jgi:hypothetical protein
MLSILIDYEDLKQYIINHKEKKRFYVMIHDYVTETTKQDILAAPTQGSFEGCVPSEEVDKIFRIASALYPELKKEIDYEYDEIVGLVRTDPQTKISLRRDNNA